MPAETSELRRQGITDVTATKFQKAHRAFKFRTHITTVFFVTGKGSQMKTYLTYGKRTSGHVHKNLSRMIALNRYYIMVANAKRR